MELTKKIIIPIRFSEVDSLGIVWHGHYVKFLEDGREAFNSAHGLSYLDVYNYGYVIPIVELNLSYKQPLRYGDRAVVEAKFINNSAAKICFEYIIYRESDGAVAATGSSVQVFLNLEGELVYYNPPFFEEWKNKMGFDDKSDGK